MPFFTICAVAVGLSMDALAASVCKGLALGRAKAGQAALVGLWFGGFQALMPALGYALGAKFQAFLAAYTPWTAFLLLFLIGANMLREALLDAREEEDAALSCRAMLPLALATSMDALAVGVTFALLKEPLFPAAALIGACTFALSFLGVRLGALFGARYEKPAGILGGVILMALGFKILLESLA